MNGLMETQELFELIKAQRDVLVELRKFAAAQYEIVKRNELGKLVSLLARKQTAINRLTDIDNRLEPFRSQDPESRVWSSEEQRQVCRQLAKECPELLASLMKLEQDAEALLRERREEVVEKFDQKTARSEAAAAYLKQDVSSPAASRWSVRESE